MGRSNVGTWPPPSGQPTWIDWWDAEKKLESNFCSKHSKMSSRRTIIPSLMIIWQNEDILQHKMWFHFFSYTSRHQRTREKTGEKQVKIGLTYWSQKTFWLGMETCHFAHSRRKSWPTLRNFFEWWTCTGKIWERFGKGWVVDPPH